MRNKTYYIIHSTYRGHLNMLYGLCEKFFSLRYIATPPKVVEGCGLSLRVELNDIKLLQEVLLNNLNLIPKNDIEIYISDEKGIKRVYDLF